MPGRLPKTADFAPHLVLSITPPPSSQKPTNVLILLHGLGDSHIPFTRLAQQLNLPETACVSVRGPVPLPDAIGLGLQGWHWGDDIVLDNSTGGVDLVDVPYNASLKAVLEEIILDALVGKCGYELRDIMIYGFGQGGTIGLSVGCEVSKRPIEAVKSRAYAFKPEMGGIISIGGPLPSVFKPGNSPRAKSKTPVLVLHGSSQSAITISAANHVKAAFENAEIHRWNKVGDSMPASRDEMLPIMRLFARRLRSRAGVPSGAMEIT